MSALAIPPSPRLRAVSAASAQEAAAVRLTALPGGETSAAQAAAPQTAGPGETVRQVRSGRLHRGHLRLVVQESSAADADGDLRALPLELTRRPRRPAVAGRTSRLSAEELARSTPSPRDVSGTRHGLDDLAPAHPAVRAARARRAQAAVSRGARVQRQPRPMAATRSEVPAALRRLGLAVACVLALVLIAAAAVVASGFNAAPEHTAVTTVQPGQSIWDLAAATGSSDVAETAAQIVELNNLTSSTLQAGQTLIVPAG
ncbi:LysM peptidoglycan-binding domain-containing protein [Actinomyces respiraculi]|uniref:LysM peptidoglycan-binding domain-containing protein n=1 Tax=Actinomyces respiraculi TaxID=2744574 RepID=UPI001F282BC5|nr:LysM peptidoglycan-binding domain-containing protein [Actinomyces respiraculi]